MGAPEIILIVLFAIRVTVKFVDYANRESVFDGGDFWLDVIFLVTIIGLLIWGDFFHLE
jgi:hypothetical protein